MSFSSLNKYLFNQQSYLLRFFLIYSDWHEIINYIANIASQSKKDCERPIKVSWHNTDQQTLKMQFQRLTNLNIFLSIHQNSKLFIFNVAFIGAHQTVVSFTGFYLLFMLAHKLTRLLFKITIEPPKVDLTRYLNKSPGWEDDCAYVAKLMKDVGLIYAFDPRVDYSKNDAFLDLMEAYFQRRSQQFDQGMKDIDVCKEGDLPKGLKFAFNQKLPTYMDERVQLKEPNLPLTPIPTDHSPNWRYHFLVNNSSNIIPKDFPNFQNIIEEWGKCLFGAGIIVTEMMAIGLNLDKKAISKYIQNGSLYLSPPAVDLTRSQLGKTILGFHRDFDLLTVHGKCRYSGLYAWLLTREKFMVKMPENHILVQGGKQLQWITGGHIRAGYHQVIHNELVEEQKQKAIKEGKIPWRIASTLFCHVQGDLSMRPLEPFRTPEIQKVYTDITADEYLIEDYKLVTEPEAK